MMDCAGYAADPAKVGPFRPRRVMWCSAN